MKKLIKYSLLPISSFFLGMNAVHATSYQIFADLNFSNPAALNSVKNDQLVIGGMVLSSQFRFNGTAAGASGTATSNTTDVLPYGRIAKRIAPRLVASFDVTQPYYTNIQYPVNSIVNAFATSTVIRDTNYSPKLSYQVTDRLALGVGIDANYLYNAQLNFAVPPFGNLTNKASSWAMGWDMGLFYVITPATFLNLSFYSKIVQHAYGQSTWGPFQNNSTSADVKLPATTTVNLIQMLSPRWALSGTVRYAEWSTLRYTVIQNSAATNVITVPALFFNNISAELATHYQINNKWGILGAFEYEPNVQPTSTRNVGLPTYTRYIPAVGADYELTKGLKAKFIYAYINSRPPISMSIAPGVTAQGRESVNANAFDFSLTYDI